MAEKSDEDIIKELGLETSDELNAQEALDQLSLDNNERDEDILAPVEETSEETINNNAIENEDRDEIKEDKKKYEDTENNIEEEVIPIQKKQPKIYKILISIAAFLFLILIIGTILYLTGFFDPEPIKPTEEKTVDKKIVKEINFDENDINKARLNKKLSMLTKHEIMNKEELESEEKRIKKEERIKKEAEEKVKLQKKQEEEALVLAQLEKLEKEKKILEDQQKTIKEEQEKFMQIHAQAKEELIQAQAKLLEELNDNKIVVKNLPEESYINETEEIEEVDSEEVEKEAINNKTFLSFINVATIKGELYKSFLDEVQKYSKNISLCRDQKNRIEIYFGPFDSMNEREKVFNNLLENGFKESYLIDFTNEEYQKRCKY